MSLVVTVAATESYCYAMKTLGRRVAANVFAAGITEPGVAIIAGDNSRQVKDAVKSWKESLPANWTITHLNAGEEKPDEPNYKIAAQMLIATLRGAAFTEARRLNPEFCWSLDSDTLPPPNALGCSMDMLCFDGGYYSVSSCPYPNEAFLGGRGTQFNTIAQDYIEDERILTDELKAERIALEAEIKRLNDEKVKDLPQEFKDRRKKYDEAVNKCPPDGNVFQVIAKHGWRRRGWFETAYPGIGKGSVVPSDWCGFGCTLMNPQALSLANFEGYDGQGTEDLYVVWRRWWPAGLRINCIPHCPCDHVMWAKKKGGSPDEYTLILSLHETQGECIGHLRTMKQPWREI
ncbi:MAG TPA: hypothetical protein VN829_24175 [Dongiaceae bacterium]|nr:hypothetical protein [Dongiaceae bacterium]